MSFEEHPCVVAAIAFCSWKRLFVVLLILLGELLLRCRLAFEQPSADMPHRSSTQRSAITQLHSRIDEFKLALDTFSMIAFEDKVKILAKKMFFSA